MTFYVQHGYGKGQKIAAVADGGHLGGVLLSPGDEDPGTLQDTAQYSGGRGLEVLVDPQTYLYSTRPEGRGRNHQSHVIAMPGLSWAQDAQSVATHIQRVGDINTAVNADGRWIAPSPLQDSFADVWTPLSVQFARTAAHAWGSERTIATIAVEEAGLADWGAIERWLDVATTLPVRGFYLLISRPTTIYPGAPWAPTRLANLLRLIHALAAMNEYEVTWGFSDLEGLIGLAAGATGAASGWSYTLRQFSSAKWMSPPSGGRAPAVRTQISRLWSLPRAEIETSSLFESDLRDAIFTSAEIASFERTPFSAINRVDAQVSHLKALAEKAAWLTDQPDLARRLDTVQESLVGAVGLWDSIAGTGILTDPGYRSRVSALADAVALFREEAAV